MALVNFQLGKAGLTEGFIESLRLAFTKNKVAKISFLPSSTRDKEEMKKIAEEICAKLDDEKHKYIFKLIGFTLTVRRLGK